MFRDQRDDLLVERKLEGDRPWRAEDGCLITQERPSVFHVFSGDSSLRLTEPVEVKDRMVKADKDDPDAEEKRSNCDENDRAREHSAVVASRRMFSDESLGQCSSPGM